MLDFQITENYNNSANLSIIYKNELGPRQSFNNFEFDVGTLLGITVLDTFSDHFNFFWDKDVSFFNQHRKEIIVENSSVNFFEIDTTNRNIKYNGPFKESLKNLRLIIGVCLTILFYIFILFFSVKQKKYRLYILSPFIGMLILLINALGFPTNNFDPFVASRVEGGPMAVLECATTKTPIISTDVGIASQILHPSSIYDLDQFENALPNIDHAFNQSKNFVISNGMKPFNKMMNSLYES